MTGVTKYKNKEIIVIKTMYKLVCEMVCIELGSEKNDFIYLRKEEMKS